MLPQIKMVKKALESLYEGRCDIVEHQKVRKANNSVGFEDVIVVENQPCRLSYKTIEQVRQNEDLSGELIQTIKLFISPEINVKPGSKIIITQNEKTTEYKASSNSAIYQSHQEIELELFERWS